MRFKPLTRLLAWLTPLDPDRATNRVLLVLTVIALTYVGAREWTLATRNVTGYWVAEGAALTLSQDRSGKVTGTGVWAAEPFTVTGRRVENRLSLKIEWQSRDWAIIEGNINRKKDGRSLGLTLYDGGYEDSGIFKRD
jgi:hypothetical protein